MTRIGHLDNDRLDVRHVVTGGDPVVQKTAVVQPAVVTVMIRFVQRPADALHRTALQLALDITRMDRSAHILHHRVTQDLDLARVGVNLDVRNVRPERAARLVGVHRTATHNRTARLQQLSRQLLETNLLTSRTTQRRTVDVLDRIRIDVPQ